MTRNLKALGLAFAATLIMGAMAASAAQAEPTVTPASYPAILTTTPITGGSVQNYTTNTGQEVNCTGISGGETTITKAGVGDTKITATNIAYSPCTAKVGTSTLPAKVNMTGCDYKFSGGVESGAGHFIGGSVALEGCTSTGPDVFIYQTEAKETANEPLCTITVWSAVLGGEITTTNTAGTPNDFDIKAINVENHVTRDGSILCGNPATAKYNGEVTVKAYEDISGNEGSQIGVTVSE